MILLVAAPIYAKVTASTGHAITFRWIEREIKHVDEATKRAIR
jgi:hypothetical protein